MGLCRNFNRALFLTCIYLLQSSSNQSFLGFISHVKILSVRFIIISLQFCHFSSTVFPSQFPSIPFFFYFKLYFLAILLCHPFIFLQFFHSIFLLSYSFTFPYVCYSLLVFYSHHKMVGISICTPAASYILYIRSMPTVY